MPAGRALDLKQGSLLPLTCWTPLAERPSEVWGVELGALRASPESRLALGAGQSTLKMICELFEVSAEGGRALMALTAPNELLGEWCLQCCLELGGKKSL